MSSLASYMPGCMTSQNFIKVLMSPAYSAGETLEEAIRVDQERGMLVRRMEGAPRRQIIFVSTTGVKQSLEIAETHRNYPLLSYTRFSTFLSALSSLPIISGMTDR